MIKWLSIIKKIKFKLALLKIMNINMNVIYIEQRQKNLSVKLNDLYIFLKIE